MECAVCNEEMIEGFSDQVGVFRICSLCMGDWIKMLRERVFSAEGWHTQTYKRGASRRLRLKTK